MVSVVSDVTTPLRTEIMYSTLITVRYLVQYCGSGSLRIRIILPDPNPKFAHVETDQDPTYCNGIFEDKPTPTRYAYTYSTCEVQYTYEV